MVDVLHGDAAHDASETVGVPVIASGDSEDAAASAVEIVDGGHDDDTDADVHGAHLVGVEETVGQASDERQQGAQQRIVRGRYAKFTASMDVLLLEAMRTHNPFTAKHGTRLQMWQQIAETVGEELLKNPDAYSWHTCRDRVTTLMKLYADGKHDKLFKHGTVEENTRKESILRELNLVLHRKGTRQGALLRSPSLLDSSLSSPLVLHSGNSTSVAFAAAVPAMNAASAPQSGRQPSGRTTQAAQKRRRIDGANRNGADSGQLDGETFRARALELMETKIQFDMEQRVKENELREQEFELQKRFLEYLQSK